LKFLDPTQPGQIMRAIAEAVIDVPSILAINFPAFNVRVTATKTRARFAFHFREMRWPDKLARAAVN
jgi:hypothetical protein